MWNAASLFFFLGAGAASEIPAPLGGMPAPLWWLIFSQKSQQQQGSKDAVGLDWRLLFTHAGEPSLLQCCFYLLSEESRLNLPNFKVQYKLNKLVNLVLNHFLRSGVIKIMYWFFSTFCSFISQIIQNQNKEEGHYFEWWPSVTLNLLDSKN